MVQAERPVNLAPSAFQEPDVYELPADEVLRLLHRQESKRGRDSGEPSQREVAVEFRSAPEGLFVVLDHISLKTGMSRAVITKCLSHKVMAWYRNIPQVGELVRLYREVHLSADGYPDAVRLLNRSAYEFSHTADVEERGRLRSIAFVRSYLSELGPVLGAPAYRLFLSGICWAISTSTEEWSEQSVNQYLVPEGEHLMAYINERMLLFHYIGNLLSLRRGELKG